MSILVVLCIIINTFYFCTRNICAKIVVFVPAAAQKLYIDDIVGIIFCFWWASVHERVVHLLYVVHGQVHGGGGDAVVVMVLVNGCYLPAAFYLPFAPRLDIYGAYMLPATVLVFLLFCFSTCLPAATCA